MSYVYVYAPNEDDCSTIGICGALVPTTCTFHEIANGESTLTLEHPYDDLRRYSCLQEDYILKAPVPVRNAPEVQNGQYINSVAIYTTKSGYDLNIYSKEEKGKKLKKVSEGSTVTVLKIPEDGDRYRVSYQSGKKTITGWMESSALQYSRSISVSPTASGLEDVTPSWTVKDQLFRIYSVEKSETQVKVEARHISYDWMYDLVKLSDDNYTKLLSDTNLSDALNIMLSSCLTNPPDFTVDTVITGSRAGILWDDKDPITCLLDPEIGVCTRWGGQLIRDNNNLYVLYDCGLHRGVMLQYGKNISGITYTVDTSNIATAILPIGETAKGIPLHMSQSYVQSDTDPSVFTEISGDTQGVIYVAGHSKYPVEKVYSLECDDCKVADSGSPTKAQVLARMLTQGKQSVIDGCVNPTVTVSVDFEVIGDSVQYEQYKNLENLFLYDYATARYTRDGQNIIDVEVTVSEIEWDVTNDRMKELTLGSLTDLSSKVASWQISSSGSNVSGSGGVSYNDVSSIALSSVLTALNDTSSDIYKRIVEIVGGA